MKGSFRSWVGVFCALLLMAIFPGCASKGNNASSANNATNAGGASAGQPQSSSAAASEGSAQQAAPAPQPVTVPAGTEIHVYLDTAVSSRNSAPGDQFDATVSEPVIVRGQVVIRRQARARGVVVDARPSGRLSKPAFLAIELRSVQINGAWVPVRTRSLTMEGKSHKKRDIIAIGGGSALGAIVGAIAGGGKGAAIGAAAGGGAGTAGAALTGKQDITLPAESRLAFRLARAVTVPLE